MRTIPVDVLTTHTTPQSINLELSALRRESIKLHAHVIKSAKQKHCIQQVAVKIDKLEKCKKTLEITAAQKQRQTDAENAEIARQEQVQNRYRCPPPAPDKYIHDNPPATLLCACRNPVSVRR